MRTEEIRCLNAEFFAYFLRINAEIQKIIANSTFFSEKIDKIHDLSYLHDKRHEFLERENRELVEKNAEIMKNAEILTAVLRFPL